MAEQDEAPLTANDLEKALTDIINQHGLNPTHTPSRFIARYLIRQIDNYREMEQEVQDDYVRQQITMGGTSEEVGHD